ncbi:MAG: AMP-binding protein [Roseiarcus sp.]
MHDLVLPSRFDAQVEQTPRAIASVFADRSLTYAELNARANQLAQHLRCLGAREEQVVAVCTERSDEMLIALLAVLKAGGVYLPLDPAYPRERLAHILTAANARALEHYPIKLHRSRLKRSSSCILAG